MSGRPRLAHSTVYGQLALWAARTAGAANATEQDVAADEQLRAKRDELVMEYEVRLRDSQTYRIDDVWAWTKKHGVKAGRSSVNRDRKRLLADERQAHLAGKRTAQMVQAAKATGLDQTFQGGMALAAQHMFNWLSDLPEAALTGMTPGQILQGIETFGRLGKVAAERELIQRREEELRRRFDEEIAKAMKRGDGQAEPVQFTDEMIGKVRKAVFG